MEIKGILVTTGQRKPLEDWIAQIQASRVASSARHGDLFGFCKNAFGVVSDESTLTRPLPTFAAARRHARLVGTELALITAIKAFKRRIGFHKSPPVWP